MDAPFPSLLDRDEFQVVEEDEATPGKHVDHSHEASFLWSELHHLGNAGFDPRQFRIDPYGNVLFWSADPSSPLAWELDHCSPSSKGGGKRMMGRTVRLVQWQVAQLKHQKLEFLMPWWDLQVGISVNQFLLIYASKNADFKKRAFSLLFPKNEADEAHRHIWPLHFEQADEAHRHIWPLHFEQRDEKEMLKERIDKDPGAALMWPYVEKQALVDRDVNSLQLVEKKQNLRPYDPSALKDQILHELVDELVKSYSLLSSSMQQQNETGRQLSMEVERKKEQVLSMEKELKRTRLHNERERIVLRELEDTLEKHKQQLEKQRHWSETQARYRKCLERISRDTLHHEQAKLHEAACDALLTKIQSQKMSCKKAELDLIDHLKQRQDLELESAMYKGLIRDGPGSLEHTMDKAEVIIDQNQNVSCDKVLWIDDVCSDSSWTKHEENCVNEEAIQVLASKGHPNTVEIQSRPSSMWMDTIMEEEDEDIETEESGSESQQSPLKRKKVSDLDSSQWQTQIDVKSDPCSEKIIFSNGDRVWSGYQERKPCGEVAVSNTSEEEKQLDELLQEVLTLEGQPYDMTPQAGALESEEDRKKRLGKLNVDKWLQRLLLSNGFDIDKNEGKPKNQHIINQCSNKDQCVDEKQEVSGSVNSTRNEEKSRKVLDGLFRMMNFRQEEKTCEGFVKRRREDMREVEKKRKQRIKHVVYSQSQSQYQSYDHHHQDKATEKLKVDLTESPKLADTTNILSDSLPSCSDNVVKRSYSMSSTSDPWMRHTNGSESTAAVFVFEEGKCVSEGREAIFHDGYNDKRIVGSIGLRASLRTSCRKAWNRARSRREIHTAITK